MFDDLTDLYQEVILEHAKNHRNFRGLPAANRVARGRNPLCGDNSTASVLTDDAAVKEATFRGSGCAISEASELLLTSSIAERRACLRFAKRRVLRAFPASLRHAEFVHRHVAVGFAGADE